MPAMKRTAADTASGAKAPKAAKPAKPSGPILAVAKGLVASDLPKPVREMLEKMLPTLDVCKEKRDKFQSKVVDLIEGVLSTHSEALKTKVKESEALVSEETTGIEELEGKVVDKEGEVQTKHVVVVAKKRELAEAATSFWSAREVVDEAQAKAQSDDMEAMGKTAEKEMLASLLNDFQNHAGSQADDLTKRIAAAGANESMVLALPAMLSKPASERGSFDAMVFTSVQEWLGTRIAATDEAIQNAEPTKAANADVLRKAETALQERREQQLDGADAYWKVRSEEEELEKEFQELRRSLRKLRDAARKHQAMSSKAHLTLEAFQQGPMTAFEQLRDKAEEVAPAADAGNVDATIEGAEQEAAAEAVAADVDAVEAVAAS